VELFLTTRLAVWIAVVGAFLVFDAFGSVHWTDPNRIRELGYALETLARWDAGWFLDIARHGYSAGQNSPAFFPFYPAIVGVVGRIFAGHYLLAGVVVSLAAGAVAFRLLDRLGTLKVGAQASRRALLYLALFPMSIFLGVPYSESLYLMLAVGAFLYAESGQLPLAGAFAGCAMLTRTAGIALLMGLVILCWQRRRERGAHVGLALALALAALYPLFLWWKRGSPVAFLDAQRGWDRYWTWWGPLEGIGRGLNAGFQGVRQLVAGPDAAERFWAWSTDTTPARAAALSLVFALTLLLLIGLSISAFRVLGPAYGVFCLASLLLPLTSPTHGWPLLSLPRFALGMFPVFLVLGALRVSPRTHAYLLAASTLLLGIVVCQWATFRFVS
jgi:hypothetical protein